MPSSRELLHLPAHASIAAPVGRTFQPCSLPQDMQAELDRLPEHARKAAFRIAIGPTPEARNRVWLEVPAAWRRDVSVAVALMMGALLGTRKPFAQVEAAIHDQVPLDLRGEVQEQALRVYVIGMPKPYNKTPR